MTTKREIYDDLSRVLTDYEEGNADTTDLYDMLVTIQNRWEDTITVQETDDRLPRTYAELEYTSEQLESDPEAIEGAKWDDMNYRHYMER